MTDNDPHHLSMVSLETDLVDDNPDPSKIIREILIEDTTVHQSQIKWD